MPNSNHSYTSLPFPAARKVIVDAGRWGARRHLIHALLEIDVTQARQLMQSYKTRTGKTLSFTGFLEYCERKWSLKSPGSDPTSPQKKGSRRKSLQVK